jgi:hypothetical protein
LTSVLPQTTAVMPVTCGRRAQRARVVERQRAHRGRNAGRRGPGGLGLARRDADDVGAELGELGEHEAVDALADRGQQDHRGDADGDAEQRSGSCAAGAR